jgi:hypothetical protein
MKNETLISLVTDKANSWLEGDYDADTKKEIQQLLDNEDKSPLIDAFYKDLEFGTGGLRGIMGAGSNRMNIYTVGTATQGLSNYLKKEFANHDQIKVVIGHDCRNNSRKFAEVAADIFSANGIKVYLFETLRHYIKESKAIRFEGNGYSEEWKKEAGKRGLDCETSVPLIYDAYTTPQSIEVFESLGVLSEKELHARNEVKWETYTKKIQIEGRVLGDLCMNHIIPVATEYQTMLLDNIYKMKSVFDEKKFEKLSKEDAAIIEEIADHITAINRNVYEMVEARKVANKIEDAREKAIAYHDTVETYFSKIRYHVDKLELIVDNRMWTLPKYRELLFIS